MELHRTDNPILLAMLMLSLPLNPEKEEFTALKEDYLIAPDWRSINMLKLLKRALAGDAEIATLLLWLGGYGNSIDQAIAEESQIFGVFMKQELEHETKEAGAGSQNVSARQFASSRAKPRGVRSIAKCRLVGRQFAVSRAKPRVAKEGASRGIKEASGMGKAFSRAGEKLFSYSFFCSGFESHYGF